MSQKKPNFDKIEPYDLQRPERLKELYIEAVRRGFWLNTEAAALNFFAFAEKALADDKYGTPGKLFYALIKQKNFDYITDGQEDRARAKLTSYERSELVDAAGSNTGLVAPANDEIQNILVGRNIGYHHSVMVQCFLPQARPKDGVTSHQLRHGRASLLIEAGKIADPDREHEFKLCQVPWGAHSRLIIPYINKQAVVTKSPVIDLGTSLRDFMASVGVPVSGQNGRAMTAQIENIAAAQFLLGEWDGDRTTTKAARVSNQISFWLERDENQATFWNPEMVLSPEYYQSILERPVPLDMAHLNALRRSPRRMDLYGWFSYRLPQIRGHQPLRLKLDTLQAIFAPEINTPRLFKRRLITDLKAIAEVYSHFKIDLQGDILLLWHSPSPVPRARSLAVV